MTNSVLKSATTTFFNWLLGPAFPQGHSTICSKEAWAAVGDRRQFTFCYNAFRSCLGK